MDPSRTLFTAYFEHAQERLKAALASLGPETSDVRIAEVLGEHDQRVWMFIWGVFQVLNKNQPPQSPSSTE